MLFASIEKKAALSADRQYRYLLERRWSAGPLMPFCMLNPSTADEYEDDPTIRRCMGFALREAAAGIIIGNLFAYRVAQPRMLREVADPIGAANFFYLGQLAEQASNTNMPIICGWGVSEMASDFHIKRVCDLLRGYGGRLACLGTTLAGRPRHPLYIKRTAPILDFAP